MSGPLKIHDLFSRIVFYRYQKEVNQKMKVSNLLISGLSITEDYYHYKGMFILSCENKSLHIDLAELDDQKTLACIKNYFDIEQSIDEIRNELISRIVKKAGISSRIVEGEHFFMLAKDR
jgi:hypothetical protein